MRLVNPNIQKHYLETVCCALSTNLDYKSDAFAKCFNSNPTEWCRRWSANLLYQMLLNMISEKYNMRLFA